MRKIFFLSTIILVFVANIFAQAPENYYNSAQDLCGEALRSELFSIIKSHTTLSYDALWDAYEETDNKGNNKIWDMYSNCEFTIDRNKCGNYSSECDCYNREHSMPKSWFNEASPMKTDLFHVYPTDGYVNGRRSNYPFGEVSNPTYTSHNGSKLGPNSYPGYNGTAFEPIDEYKGDFARTYFYMSTCYKDKNLGQGNGSSTFSGSVLKEWAANMLLEWHRNDPVSEKEIARNNAVYEIQGNRNPFIDCPEFAEAIWGNNCNTRTCFSADTTDVETKIDFAKEEKFTLTPNPASENIKITAERTIKIVHIYNLLGVEVLTKNTNSTSVEIEISHLPQSTYFVRVEYENDYKSTQKLLIY